MQRNERIDRNVCAQALYRKRWERLRHRRGFPERHHLGPGTLTTLRHSFSLHIEHENRYDILLVF